MRYRITVMCENSVGPLSGTLGEHGFSALIEPSEGQPVLFDTGQGLTLLHNAHRMNKDLSAVGMVVLSHGHYDHTGGLLPLLNQYGKRRVCGHPGIFASRFRITHSGECLSIGIPQSRTELESAGALFDLSTEFRELIPDVFLTGEIIRRPDFDSGDHGLFCDRAGRHSDRFPDDQALVIKTDKGLVVILGCCHSGVVNTLQHCAKKTGRSDVYALIGGTHLGFCSYEHMEHAVAAIKEWKVNKIAVSHCTGFAASARLAREFPKEFHVAHVGYTLEI